LRRCATKPQGHGINYLWCHWVFFFHLLILARALVLESTQPLTEMSNEDIYLPILTYIQRTFIQKILWPENVEICVIETIRFIALFLEIRWKNLLKIQSPLRKAEGRLFKLKIIKNCLQITLRKEILNSLSSLAIEDEGVQKNNMPLYYKQNGWAK
jgi:hypothetical protein